jgi:hypothetical protein
MIRLVMNNELERTWEEAVVRIMLAFAWKDGKIPRKSSIQITGLPADIWTLNVPNKMQES